MKMDSFDSQLFQMKFSTNYKTTTMCEFLHCPICEAEASDLCPCDEPESCTCLNGWILMDDSGNILTQEEFDHLPANERLKDNCSRCNPARLVNGKWIFIK